MPPQGIIPEGSPYSRELSLRMHLAAALILDGRERWVRQADQALAASSGSSFRPISTSNGGGSRLASSRGPWTSAELASRPVRRGRSKPKENALDSRKVGGHAIKIPGVGKGLKFNYGISLALAERLCALSARVMAGARLLSAGGVSPGGWYFALIGD